MHTNCKKKKDARREWEREEQKKNYIKKVAFK